jgi:hypothetical protein
MIRERAIEFKKLLKKQPQRKEMEKSWQLALQLRKHCSEHNIFIRALQLLQEQATVEFNPHILVV